MSQAFPSPIAHTTVVLHAISRELVAVAGVALSLAAASRIVLPLGFTPVPVTAQTFVVLIVGILAGARRSGFGSLLYLVLGVAGVPWFATGGATLGYLAAFGAAAVLVGRAAGRGRLDTRRSALIVMTGAHALIYVLGAAWLGAFLGIGPAAALKLGVAPFLLGDAVKVIVASAIAPHLVATVRSGSWTAEPRGSH